MKSAHINIRLHSSVKKHGSQPSDFRDASVLQELGLPENPNVPVLAFIGRLDEQKGVDLIRESFDWLMSEGVQLILLGSGREDLENSLR